MNDKKYAPYAKSVQSIADALHMKLLLRVGKDSANVNYSEQSMEIDTGGVMFELKPLVQSSCVSGNQAWLLARIKGDLWIYIASFDAGKELYFWIVDAGLLARTRPGNNSAWSANTSRLKGGLSADKAAALLEPFCVAVYSKAKGDTKWQEKHGATRGTDRLVQ